MVSYKALNTVPESIIADACHAVGDGNGGQAAASRESIIADACHAVGDGDGGQTATARESRTADARHAVGEGDGGQAVAVAESSITDACHAVGDGNGGQATANLMIVDPGFESRNADARHAVSNTIILKRCRYSDFTSVFAISTCHFRLLYLFNEIVIDAINLDIIRKCVE